MKATKAEKAKRAKKWGTGLIIGGVVLLVLAAALVGYNAYSDRQAQQASEEVLQQMPEEPADTLEDAAQLPLYLSNPDMEMPTTEIDGHAYIGRIDIPAVSISLPVMSQWSYDNLKIAPCRYTGSAYKGDLVIAAHNYRSHFGPLKRLAAGDAVTFTDADGNEFRYQVACLEQVGPFEVNTMTDSGYPLTLFTCTLGGSYRVAVRCVEAS